MDPDGVERKLSAILAEVSSVQRLRRKFAKQTAVVGRELTQVPEAETIGHIRDLHSPWIFASQFPTHSLCRTNPDRA